MSFETRGGLPSSDRFQFFFAYRVPVGVPVVCGVGGVGGVARPEGGQWGSLPHHVTLGETLGPPHQAVSLNIGGSGGGAVTALLGGLAFVTPKEKNESVFINELSNIENYR